MSDPFNDEEGPPHELPGGWKEGNTILRREELAVKALRQAMDLQDELDGVRAGVGSQFAAYIEHAQEIAAKALVKLARYPFSDPTEVLALQKEIQPFNSVIQWIEDIEENGERAAKEIEAAEEDARADEQVRRLAQGDE